MNIKKPSVRRMKHVGYLGRFQKDKFIQQGHNSKPKDEMETVIVGGGPKYEMIGTQDFGDEGEMSSDKGTAVVSMEKPYKKKNKEALERVSKDERQQRMRRSIEKIKQEIRLENEVKKREKMRQDIKRRGDY